MTLYRLRRYGSADWLTLSLDGEDELLEEQLDEQIADLLAVDGLHAQRLTEGEWEDLDA